MAVAARVVSNPAVAAILAALDMAAKDRRAALLDRRHHLELTEAHMPGIGSPPGGAGGMKDVRDLQPRAAPPRGARPGLSVPSRPGARAGRAGWSRCGS